MPAIACLQAHDDDVTIAAGGTLARLAQHDWNIGYIDLTDGRHGSDKISPERLPQVREKEANRERKIFGGETLLRLQLEDGSLGQVRSSVARDVTNQVTQVLYDFDPDVLLLPSRYDAHPDHVAVCDIVFGPSLPANRLVLKYLVWFLPPYLGQAPEVKSEVLVVGIDDVMATKEVAIRTHKSQAAGRYHESSRSLSHYFALTLRANMRLGQEHTEVFGIFGGDSERVAALTRDLRPCFAMPEQTFGRALTNLQKGG